MNCNNDNITLESNIIDLMHSDSKFTNIILLLILVFLILLILLLFYWIIKRKMCRKRLSENQIEACTSPYDYAYAEYVQVNNETNRISIDGFYSKVQHNTNQNEIPEYAVCRKIKYFSLELYVTRLTNPAT